MKLNISKQSLKLEVMKNCEKYLMEPFMMAEDVSLNFEKGCPGA